MNIQCNSLSSGEHVLSPQAPLNTYQYKLLVAYEYTLERNNVYLCAKYLLPIQHLDVKLLKVAINKVRRNEDVPECNTGQVILELCLVRYGNLGTEGKIKIKINNILLTFIKMVCNIL